MPADPAAVRDADRSRVYDAEHLVHRLLDRAVDFPVVEVAGSRVVLPAERHFGDLAGIQRYLDRVLALDWVRQRWPVRSAAPVQVRERRGGTRAHYELPGVIAIPVGRPAVPGDTWAMRELVVLHELAHHLDAGMGHGPEFRRTLVELVDGLLGAESALLLRVTFADLGLTS